jgi:phosphate:Na+ symporter
MITQLIGGIGLFLLGMLLLSDGLKALAGPALSSVLARFTGGRVTAVASGAAVTALVQSSHATTLTTIGFVSAGLLTFPQALGVILGANVGTTSTGWIVSLIGFKVSLASFALPVIGLGALSRLLLTGRLASLGTALAGFGLIFVGIDTLQEGMAGLAEEFDFSRFPSGTVHGRLLLVGAGLVMTVLMQSSSAAVATTLTALNAGTIDVDAAAALVIGQNLGTSVTAGVAAVGATIPARRTAVAHVAFNAVTAVIAFALLPVFVDLADFIAGDDDATAIATFHTLFNVLGVLCFLPVINHFARAIERLVPDRSPGLTRYLDDAVADVPAVALEAARRSTIAIARLETAALAAILERGGAAADDSWQAEAANARQAVRAFLARVATGPDAPREYEQHLDILHALDHLERLAGRLAIAPPTPPPPAWRETLEAWGDVQLANALAREWLDHPAGKPPRAALKATSVAMAAFRERHRAQLLERAAAGAIDPEAANAELRTLLWLDGVAYHLWRGVRYLGEPKTATDAVDTESLADTLGPA